MLETFPFLSVLIILPIIGAMFIFLFVRGDSDIAVANVKAMAFWTAVLNFIVSIIVLLKFDFATDQFQFIEKHLWIESFDMGYRLGIDGISMALVLLTTFLTPLSMLCSKNAITSRIKEYMILFLLLESFILGAFLALDLILFYVFFEIMLVPMFLIIGIWGGKDKIYASFKFFLYTFFGSIFFLLAIIFIIVTADTTNLLTLYVLLPELFNGTTERLLWLGFFIAFAVKIPMFPVHTWLPDAHVQAPTAGSVILAAILLKLGAYGFIRFSIPFFPEASFYFKDMMYILSVIAIIYTSIIAFYQTDIKKLVAYSSIAHMGFVTLGIFSFNNVAMTGAIFQMISHGVISGALFLSIGVIYDRMHTRNIADLNGIVNVMPNFSILFVIFTLGSIALPATSGFIGEFLILLGVYQLSPAVMVLAALGVILGAIYMLYLVKRMIMGEIINKQITKISDISLREMIILVPLAILVIILGIFPILITGLIDDAVISTINHFHFLQGSNN